MKKTLFFKGISDGMPICLGYLSVAFAFGIFSVGSGLSVWESVLISVANVTSAGQLAGVPVIAAGGSLWEMAASQLVINLRYALMSVSLSQKLDASVTLPHRLCIAFVNTDEVFAVASAQQGRVGCSYLYGLILPPFLGWSLGTLLGAAAGDVLPHLFTCALGIAIYGMFIAIVTPEVRRSRAAGLCVLLAAGLSCLFRFLPFLSQVPSGFVIIVCAVISSAVLAFAAPLEPAQEDEDA